MKEFINYISNNNLLAVFYLLGASVFLLFLIMIIDQLNKKKKRKINQEEFDFYNTPNSEEEITLQEESTPKEEPESQMSVAKDHILDDINIDEIKKSMEHTMEIDEIKYVAEDEELEKTKAQIELQALKEELAKYEQEQNQSKEVIPMIQENNQDLTYEEKIDKYELGQEESAIISLDALAQAQNQENFEDQIREDSGDEPISIQELEKLYKEVEVIDNQNQEEIKTQEIAKEVKTLDDFTTITKPITEVYKEVKTTPFISPVYGVATEKEQTASTSYDKLNEELKKTNEFLTSLKELKKNLE